MAVKYVFVTGGVVSGLGKGITAASLGRLLKARGYQVTMQKFDPYINVDPGTMNPIQHGEVFVTDDGTETDLDLGHYERFIDESLDKNSNVTTGKIYWSVLQKERHGDYGGGTVQVIPHITNEIKSRFYRAKEENEDRIAIIEVGGTVGDIESQPFLEAIRQMRAEVGRDNCLYIHVTLVPYLNAANELKTKPTQHSVKELSGLGIAPDILVCRAERSIPEEMRAKIGMFCNMPKDCVFENQNARSLYEVPLLLHAEHLDDKVLELLRIDAPEADLAEWRAMVERQLGCKEKVNIALVRKYVELPDAYLSVVEALEHGGIFHGVKAHILWIAAETVTDENAAELLKDADGLVVPGGFGSRGLEGKMAAIRYARENGLPFLGLCLGMQMAVIEFARHVAGWQDANSAEFSGSTAHPVIALMPEQVGVTQKGGTMRLGRYPCVLAEGTRALSLYGEKEISERHRHRYEFNNDFRCELQQDGLTLAGTSPDGALVEIVEIKDHPWYVGCQFHPEFKSRPNRPHPLFYGFVKAALEAEEKR